MFCFREIKSCVNKTRMFWIYSTLNFRLNLKLWRTSMSHCDMQCYIHYPSYLPNQYTWPFGIPGHEVSFGLAPRNGKSSHANPETPEPFNSPFRTRNPERRSDPNSPQNSGSLGKTWGPGAHKPRDKCSLVQLDFLTIEMVKFEFCFWLVIWYAHKIQTDNYVMLLCVWNFSFLKGLKWS